MTTPYAYVENNEIKEIHYFLPTTWKNVSNFHLLSQDELKSKNWLPIVDGEINYDPTTQEPIDFTLQVLEDRVERIYIYQDKLIEEIITQVDEIQQDQIETQLNLNQDESIDQTNIDSNID